jgi:outer membrane protein TolC
MKNIVKVAAFAGLLTLSGRAYSQMPNVWLSLDQVEEMALENSDELKSAMADFNSSKNVAASQNTLRYPSLLLEGQYNYVTRISEISLAGGGSKKLGDNSNYSIGPSLYWTIWDNGALKYNWRSFENVSNAKKEEVENIRRQVLLKARMTYFNLQLALEQSVLLFDNLRLSSSQYSDISISARAGAKSRIDQLLSHQEVYSRESDFYDSVSTISSVFNDLLAITKIQSDKLDTSFPVDKRIMGIPFKQKPTVAISLDSIDDTLKRFENMKNEGPDFSIPSVKALEELMESYRMAQKSYDSKRYGELTLKARSSLDYPLGPKLISFNQNSIGIFASVPLFEFGRKRHLSQSEDYKALSAEQKIEKLKTDIRTAWNKSVNEIELLKLKRDSRANALEESEELSKLTFASYKAGTSTYLEVQAANVRELQNNVQLAIIDVRILQEMAALSNLSK